MAQQTYRIEQELFAGTAATVSLPDGRLWKDVESWFVKWDTLHVKFADATDYLPIELESETMDVVDWKRPMKVHVLASDDETHTVLDSAE